MEIINVSNIKDYESVLKKFLTEGGLNFDNSLLTQYNLCGELFDKKFGDQKGDTINCRYSVTISSDDWKEPLSLLLGRQPNQISWLISVTQDHCGPLHQVVKALKCQKSSTFCFLLVRNCDDLVDLVPIYFSFENKTGDIPDRNQSQFIVNYQEQVYRLNDAVTKQLFLQNEGCSSGADTQIQGHNNGYLVNYRNETELIHDKSITDIVEYALRTMNVQQGRIISRWGYDQIIDNMSSKLGHPTVYLANYENIQESQSIMPYDLRSLLPKSNLSSLLFGSDNQANTRRCQEMTREEVMFTASKEGQCLDIGVIYLKVDVETEKGKGYIRSSKKEKKTLHYEKTTFSMPRHKVQSIVSQLN